MKATWNGKVIAVGDTWSQDNAWTYKEPFPRAISIVRKDFSHYIAFWRDVTASE